MEKPPVNPGPGEAAAPQPPGMTLDLLAPAFMWPARVSQPYAWVEHIPFAFWITAQHQPRVMVELGTHTGNSYLAFCQAVAAFGLPTRCFAVDTWRGDPHAGLYGDDIFETLSRYHDQHYSAFSRLVRSTFDEALTQFPEHSIDLLHIDGLHLYEAVAHDYHCWIDKVSDRGIILMHDTNVRENNFGVFRLWDEVRARFPHFEFVHGHGLGVLGVGPKIAPALATLFAADPNEQSGRQIREAFARLGHAVTIQAALAEASKRQPDDGGPTSHGGATGAGAQGAAGEPSAQGKAETAGPGGSEHAIRHPDEPKSGMSHGAITEKVMGLETELHSLRRSHERQLRVRDHEVAERFNALTDELTQLRSREPAPPAGDRPEAVPPPYRPNLWSRLKARLASGALSTVLRSDRSRWRRAALSLVSRASRAVAPGLHQELRGAFYDPVVLFDRTWYVHQCPEAATGTADLFRHYVQFGAARGHDPNPLFCSNWYLEQNPDVAASGLNPLIHYCRRGAAEARDPNPYFDTDWYVAQNPDVAASGENPLLHYIRVGAPAGHDPGPGFDTRWYLANNPDLAASNLNPLEHFIRFGAAEGRIPKDTRFRTEATSFFRIARRDRLGRISADAGEPSSIGIEALVPSGNRDPLVPPGLGVDVIVPVYRGLTETRRCIDSVLRSRPANKAFGRLILIDDHTPEPKIRNYLSGLERHEGVLLLRNSSNRGFVASTNRGISAAEANDVILLNSDTEVHGNWVDRLAAQAYSAPRIGTVTPLSNNATICSYPDIGGTPDMPAGYSLRDIDLACAQANAGRAVEIPTGVGSCMLVTRACLDDVGTLDEEVFGVGYGEEVDFCQRALKRGWRNVLAGDVFVFHVGETSFAASSYDRKIRAAALLRERYPAYEPSVARWVEQDPAMALRLLATAAAWKQSGDPVVLHLLHAAGGGTEKHVAELTDSLVDVSRHLVLIVRKESEGFGFSLLVPEGSARRVVEFTAANMIETIPFLRAFGVTQIHLQHFLAIAAEVGSFLKHFAVPYDLSLHDYTAICPRITLCRDKGAYCGEPDERGCLQCLSEGGYALGTDILWWRDLGIALVRDANRVICPSVDAAMRTRRYAPGANVVVVPHEQSLYRPARPLNPRTPQKEERLKVAAFGSMAEHKGGAYLLDCIEAAVQRDLPITWHVIGHFDAPLRPRAEALRKVLSVTGDYNVQELPSLVERVAPHVVLFPQRWPETYSYTLSEAFAAGTPVLVPAIGAFLERTVGVPWCWTYPVDLPPHKLIERLIDIRTQLERGEPASPATTAPATGDAFPVRFNFYRENYLLDVA
jgi:GT2 family glycosyltransferase/glycosyltransferase involved in cell wall biosynthesis